MTLLEQRIKAAGIDLTRSSDILRRLNAGAYDHVQPVRASGIPVIDNETIIDRTIPLERKIEDESYRRRMADLAPEIPADRIGTASDGIRHLREDDLERLGVLLYPYVAYGILNGGSATSYADRKKNSAFDPDLFELYEPVFDSLSATLAGKPKGITPAFLRSDGTAGPSFLELKFRHLLLSGRRYTRLAKEMDIRPPETGFILPVFEMTSDATEDTLRNEYERYRKSPLLSEFSGTRTILDTFHRVQPLLAALTHSSEGRPRRFFDRAFGTPETPLGLPGGHGQSFSVLAPVYRELAEMGKRFAYLGNVDNLGATVDPVGVALLALSDAQAGFDFAFRTPVDVKGGVLIYDQTGHLNCADIGPAISKDEVFHAEAGGRRILFNCATGLFDLRYLCDNIDTIAEKLPMRISDQEKDAGRYSQAEQVTWEIIGMLDSFLVFGIDKYRRFLAAKMLSETLLTSGLLLEEATVFQPTAPLLHRGLANLLAETYSVER